MHVGMGRTASQIFFPDNFELHRIFHKRSRGKYTIFPWFFFSIKDVRRWRTQEGMRVDSLWGKEGGKQESRAVKGHQRVSKNSLMIWGGEFFGSSPKPSTWAICKYGTFGCSGNLGDDKSLTRGFNCPCWNRIRVLGSCWDARAASGNAATQISFFS